MNIDPLSRFQRYAIFRVAGLPVNSLSLVFGKNTQRANIEINIARDEINLLKRCLCEQIAQVIPNANERILRRSLIDIRRSVFNERVAALRAIETSVILPNSLSTIREDLRRFCAHIEAFHIKIADGNHAVALDRAEIASELKGLFSVEPLANGILLSQPDLYNEIYRTYQKALSGDTRTRRKSRKQLERSLLAYVFRAASKTSPFSSLSSAAIVDIRPDSPNEIKHNIDEHNSEFTLNANIIERWLAVVRSRSMADLDMRLRVNPSVFIRTSTVYFVRRKAVLNEYFTSEIKESLISKNLSPETELIILLALNTEMMWTGRTLAMECERQTGLPENIAVIGISHLVELGILEPVLGFDFLCELRGDNLKAVDLSRQVNAKLEVENISLLLAEIKTKIADMQTRSVAARSVLLQEIYGGIAEIDNILGYGNSTSAKKNIIHEKRMVTFVSPLTAAAIDDVELALSQVLGIVPLFDSTSAGRLKMNRLFADKFGYHGSCNVTDFFFEYVKLNQAAKPHSPLSSAEIVSIESQLEKDFVSAKAEIISSFRDISILNKEGSCEVPSSFFDFWTQKAKKFNRRRFPNSAAFAGQFTGVGSVLENYFVLNRVLPGHGAMFGPHAVKYTPLALHFSGSQINIQLQRLESMWGENAEAVDLVGVFGFDGQIRPPLTRRCLLIPGEVVEHETRQCIQWSNLQVFWDAEASSIKLVEVKTGKRIVPIHLGTISPLLLPAVYRFLAQFGPFSVPDMQLTDLIDEQLEEPERSAIRHYPRITYGKVVLSRKTWYIPRRKVPYLEVGDKSFRSFSELVSWANGLGLPRRVFVTPMKVSEYFASDAASTQFAKLRKPFFVDWENIFSHDMFARYIKAIDGTIKISEALPHFEDALPSVDGEIRCNEAILELGGTVL